MRIYVAEEVSLGYRGVETRGGLLHRETGDDENGGTSARACRQNPDFIAPLG